MKTVDKLVRKQFKPLSLIRIDWECAFLYNLWNYIPSRWSLKSLWKMVAIFCKNPVSNLVALLFKTLNETCAIVFTLLAPRCFLLHYNKILSVFILRMVMAMWIVTKKWRKSYKLLKMLWKARDEFPLDLQEMCTLLRYIVWTWTHWRSHHCPTRVSKAGKRGKETKQRWYHKSNFHFVFPL